MSVLRHLSTVVQDELATAAAATTSDPSNQPCPWQSLFWALLAVATNVLLQNAGAVGDLDPSCRIGLRSSPIVCAVDTLCLLAKGVALVAHAGCTPRVAAEQVWRQRFRSIHAPPESQHAATWRIGMAAFALGALLQTVKIFAIHGIPGTQAAAAMFLAAFVVPEAVRCVVGRSRDLDEGMVAAIAEIDRRCRLGQRCLVGAAAVAQTYISVTVFARVMPWHDWLDRGSEGEFNGYKFETIFLQFLVLTWLPWVVYSVRAGTCVERLIDQLVEKLRLRLGDAAINRLAFVFSCCYIVYVFYIMLGIPEVVWSAIWIIDASIPVTRFVFAGVPMFILLLILRALLHIMCKGPVMQWQPFLSYAFLLLNFGAVLMYYATIYDPEGTSKPSWTDKLG